MIKKGVLVVMTAIFTALAFVGIKLGIYQAKVNNKPNDAIPLEELNVNPRLKSQINKLSEKEVGIACSMINLALQNYLKNKDLKNGYLVATGNKTYFVEIVGKSSVDGDTGLGKIHYNTKNIYKFEESKDLFDLANYNNTLLQFRLGNKDVSINDAKKALLGISLIADESLFESIIKSTMSAQSFNEMVTRIDSECKPMFDEIFTSFKKVDNTRFESELYTTQKDNEESEQTFRRLESLMVTNLHAQLNKLEKIKE